MKQLNLLLWLFPLLVGLSSQTMAQNKVANGQTPATAIAKGIAQSKATPAKQSGVASPDNKGLQARKHARRLLAGQKPTFTMLNATTNSTTAKAVTVPAVKQNPARRTTSLPLQSLCKSKPLANTAAKQGVQHKHGRN